MGKGERDKGAGGEREVAAIFRAAGFDCDRTPNSGGLRILGDLYGQVPLHVEVKRQEVWRLPLWIAQAENEVTGEPFLVAFRRNHSPWYGVAPLDVIVNALACVWQVSGLDLLTRNALPSSDAVCRVAARREDSPPGGR